MEAPTDLVAGELATSRLRLTVLRVEDAADMVPVLADSELYRFTGGAPPSLAELQERYRRQCHGPRPAGEIWLTWVLRLPDGQAVGYVQATVAGSTAQVAWVVGSPYQRRGYASEGAQAVLDWLAQHRLEAVTAHIVPGHRASEGVAAALGLRPTDELDLDGERVWERALRAGPAAAGAR